MSRIGETDLTIRLEGRQGAAKVEASYAAFKTLAEEVFLLNTFPNANLCGQMQIIFELDYPFISFDEV